MTDDPLYRHVSDNVREVLDEIDRAARQSGRTGEQVRLVAVSKYAEPGDGMVEALLAAGCHDLGEARPQRLLEKADYYRDRPEIRWHMIGSLQRNKARKILPVTELIHSLDSVRLAKALDRIAEEEKRARPVRCLLEVMVSPDTEKHGFLPDELPAALEELGRLDRIAVEGLMCMSGLESDEDRTRREFATLRELALSLREQGTPPNVRMDELSMGMSDDFELAVREGATIVRVGSRLYRNDSAVGK